MSRIVLDAGALIALERNEASMWAAVKAAALRSHDVVVPCTALAQVWRARVSQAFLGRALAHCVLAPFDSMARAVGELCGRAKVHDIVDAHVALVAVQVGGTLYTSDPGDMGRLLVHCRGTKPRVIAC